MLINEWIDEKLGDIANKLPSLIYEKPASFSCGYTMGYKTAVLDIEKILEGIIESSLDEPVDFKDFYRSTFEMSGLF